MINPEEIRKLANQRLKEAEILYQNGQYDGAYYLAGYAVELSLKAKICERLGLPNLFDETDGATNSIKGISEIRKTLKMHNLQILLIFCGLKPKFDKDKSTNLAFAKINSLLFNGWNENARYRPSGYIAAKDIQTLLTLLTRSDNLFIWIVQN
jgi:hypothetical protein